MKELALFFGLMFADEISIPRPYSNDTNGTGIRLQLSKKIDGEPYFNLHWNRNVPGLFFHWQWVGGKYSGVAIYDGE